MSEKPNTNEFRFGDSRISYQKYGSGPAILLAFHGFGQSKQVFKALDKPLGKQYTIYAIDLFFHGNSHYLGDQLLTKTIWCELISQFLLAQKINRFSLMGFSLGGRFALATTECFFNRLDQLILIAPDGITRNGWYQLATSTVLGRSLFRYVMRHLSMLTTFGHLLTRLGLLNRTIMRFAEISLGTPAQRTLVYRSWTQFRLIRPDLALLSKSLNDHAILVRFFMGAYDRIIPGSYILPLTKRLRHYELTILKTGHNHLIELTAEKLVV